MQKRLQSSVEFTEGEIDNLLKLFPKGICAIDFEMTGLSPVFDKIIEIAAIKIDPDGSLDSFHSLVNPLIEIPEHTKQYHGLENDDLRQAPSIKQPLKELIEFYGDLPLVAHSAMFDASFLIRAIHEFNLSISLSDVYDSCRLARLHYKPKDESPDNFKLSTLAQFFDINFEHHQALDDACVSLKIFAKLAGHYENKTKLREHSLLFKLTDFKKRETYLLPKKLDKLAEFLKHKTPIEIKYQGGKAKGEFRPIRPIAILPLPQGLMLYAECLKDNMNKYFQTKKIKAIKEIS